MPVFGSPTIIHGSTLPPAAILPLDDMAANQGQELQPPPFHSPEPALTARDIMLLTPSFQSHPLAQSSRLLTHQEIIQQMLLLLFSLRGSVTLLSQQVEQGQQHEQQARWRAEQAMEQAQTLAQQLPNQALGLAAWIKQSCQSLAQSIKVWAPTLTLALDNAWHRLKSIRPIAQLVPQGTSTLLALGLLGAAGTLLVPWISPILWTISWSTVLPWLGVAFAARQLVRGISLLPHQRRMIRLQKALLGADYAKHYQEQTSRLLQQFEQHVEQQLQMTQREIQRLAKMIQLELQTLEQMLRR